MILTPKEKAKELVSKYVHLAKQSSGAIGTIYNAKQCALIAVDEMQIIMSSLWIAAGINENKRSSYLEEVKKEIEKL
jgi:hypothetical protein